MEADKTGTESNGLPRAVAVSGRGISAIWILPIIAALIGAWLIYKGVVEAPIKVTINFKTAEGIVAGKTKVLYKGLEAGKVKAVEINPDLESVDVFVEFAKNAGPLLTEGTLFWLVTPQINAAEITGLETIIAGNHIDLRPGAGPPARKFKALAAPPPISEDAPGLHLILVSEDLPSVNIGSPVYYKKFQVGDVQTTQMSDDQRQFEVRIHIRPEYAPLVNKKSRFWNASGVMIEGSLSNFKLRTISLASLIKGGIAFGTPEYVRSGKPAQNKDRFTLYSDFQSAQSGIPIVIRFSTSEGLTPGQSKVKYKGVEVGYVDRIRILPDLSGVNVHVMMDPRAEPALTENTRFWMVKPEVGLTGVSNLGTLVSGTYIGVEPGKGAPRHSFVALEKSPNEVKGPDNLELVLTAQRRGSLKKGSPVYYRQVPVGEVVGYELEKTAEGVRIFVSIREKYAPLVREKSQFWNVSGVDFSILGGLKAESIESVLAGGISFATPNNSEMGKRVRDGGTFPLHDAPQNVWREWKPKIRLKL